MEIQERRGGPGAKRRGRRKICRSTSTPDQPPCEKRESVSFDPNSFFACGEIPLAGNASGARIPLPGQEACWTDRSFRVRLRVACGRDDGARRRRLTALWHNDAPSSISSSVSGRSGTDVWDDGLSPLAVPVPAPVTPLSGAPGMTIPVETDAETALV